MAPPRMARIEPISVLLPRRAQRPDPVLLACEGHCFHNQSIRQGWPAAITRHDFVRLQLDEVRSGKLSIWSCSKCGAERVYGVQACD